MSRFTTRLFAVTALTGSLLLLGACDTDEQSREDFIQDAEEQLEALRMDLEEAREDIATGEAGEDIDTEIDRLDERIEDAEADLDDVRRASEDEWEDFRDSFNQTVDDADDLADEIGSELGLN